MKRRQFTAQIATATAGLSFLSAAQAQGGPTEGKEYVTLTTQVPVTAPKGKVDVVEFFSYACPHCAEFEPAIARWTAKLPADVSFRRFPVPFLANAANFQALYYALEELKLVEKLQPKIFQAVHAERQMLSTPAEITAFVVKNGVDAAKFQAAFNSFSVQSKVRGAGAAINPYGVESVPLLVVAGRYQTSPALARGHEPALAVVNFLVQKAKKG